VTLRDLQYAASSSLDTFCELLVRVLGGNLVRMIVFSELSTISNPKTPNLDYMIRISRHRRKKVWARLTTAEPGTGTQELLPNQM
jgi:hypothetical protein